MTLTHLNKTSKLHFSGTLVSFLLVFMLVACGTNPVTISSSAESHPSSTTNRPIKTPTAIPSPSPTVFNPNTANLAEDAGSLRIQSVAGFQCPNDQAVGVQDQLVFTSDPTTYSQDEIAQIRSFMASSGPARPGGEPPPTLRWVLGGSVDRIPGAESDNNQYSAPCGADLTLTNTGNTSIQIPQVGVQLEGPPEQNSYQYRLIDACSMGVQPPCPPLGGGGAVCSRYMASIQLGLGEKGAVYTAVPQGEGENCGILTIAPATQVDLTLIFSLAANISKNLIYSILPVFTVDTGQGKQTLPLPQLVSTFAFASANQFSCYALQGTTFVLVKSPSGPPNWCM